MCAQINIRPFRPLFAPPIKQVKPIKFKRACPCGGDDGVHSTIQEYIYMRLLHVNHK